MTPARHEIDGLPIWIWPRALPAELLDELATHPRWPSGESYSGRNVVVDDWEVDAVGKKLCWHVDLPGAVGRVHLGWHPLLTFSRDTRPAPPHLDHGYQDARFKLLVYLNEVGDGSAGTKFYSRHGEATVETRCEAGTVVLFDLGIWHAGMQQPPGWAKITLGMRPRFS